MSKTIQLEFDTMAHFSTAIEVSDEEYEQLMSIKKHSIVTTSNKELHDFLLQASTFDATSNYREGNAHPLDYVASDTDFFEIEVKEIEL